VSRKQSNKKNWAVLKKKKKPKTKKEKVCGTYKLSN